MTPGKPLLAMLMSHNPSADPRVDWEAGFASSRFEVVALGIDHVPGSLPPREDLHGYRLQRLPTRRGIVTTLSFVASWLRVIGWRERVTLAALFLLGGWLLLVIPLVMHGLLFVGKRWHRFRDAVRRSWTRYDTLRHLYLFLQQINWSLAPATVVLWRELRERVQPAVVHCNDLDTLLVGVLAKRRYGCRLIYDAHEFWPYSQASAGWYYAPFYRFYERSLIRQCDAVVTVNPMLAQAIAEEYGLARVESVPNAEPWREGIAPRRGEVSELAGGRVKFLFQGGFAPDRGIEELIRAWRRVDGTKAALFLRGPRNDLRDACEALARELGLLGESVYLLEPVTEEELVAASMEADVGVIPYRPTIINHRYCCPNKLSQYLRAGLMILCNELPYVKQIVAEAGAGLSFDTRDEATVVEAIRRATDDAELRSRCGASGREHARRAFNWQQFYPVLESAYLGQPAAPARPLLAMVMSHDPTLDPRVDWEAASAAQRFEVVALGVQPRAAERPNEEHVRGYRLRRLPERLGPGVTLAFLARWLQAIGWRDRAIVIALAALGWPFVAVHLAAHALLNINAGSRRAKQSLQRGWTRYAAAAHAYFFLQEINVRFAPATVVLWDGLRGQMQPAIIHCNDLDTLLVGVLAKRRYGCRLVYDAHEFWPYSQPRSGWYYPLFFSFYEKSLIRQCDAVVTVNPMLAQAMAEEYGLARVESVPNAEPWREGIAPRRGEVSELAGGRVKFLFQGRFAGERGIEELIRAWRRVDGAKAALFLRGPRTYVRDDCEALARELGLLGESVYLLEPVAEEELVAASMEADVGVIPYKPVLLTYKYCCPNKLSQFLQAGLTILCNELPYVKQVVAEAGAGLSFDTRDEATVVEAIRRATDDAALRARCGASGREHARRAFNWQKFYPVLEAAYLGRRVEGARA